MTKQLKTRDMAKELFFDPKKKRLQKTLPQFSYDFIQFFHKLTRYAFFLNFMEEFEEAEKVLRFAGRLSLPYGGHFLYKAFWINLGVSVEHQGRYEEAAKYYVKAVHCRGKKYAPWKYLERLLVRRPSLKRISEVRAWLRTYRKQECDQYLMDLNLSE